MKSPAPTTAVARKHARLWFANDFWPRQIAERKFLFAGMTGSGKTLSIRLLFQSVMAGIGQGLNRRVLIYDAKGEWPAIYDAVTAHRVDAPKVKKLYPFDTKGYAYDFQADFNASANPFAKAINFAKTLIPSNVSKGDSSADFFTAGARLVVAWVTYLIHERTLKGEKWTLLDIIMAATDARIVEAILKQHARGRAILRIFAATPNTFSNTLQTIITHVWELEPAALAWELHLKKKRRLTFREWFKGDDALILCGNADSPGAVEPINTLMLEFMRQELRKQEEHPWHEPDVPETWLFMDEFQQLTPQANIVDLFTLSRSKGSTQVVGVQEIGQLIHHYGEHMAHTILGQCGYVGVMKLNTPPAKEYFEKRIGTKEQLIKLRQSGSSASISGPTSSFFFPGTQGSRSTSTSTSESEQLHTSPAVLASEFGHLSGVGRDLIVDGYYIADGPFARRTYSARHGAHPLALVPKNPTNYTELRKRDCPRPRAFTHDDLKRLGFSDEDAVELSSQVEDLPTRKERTYENLKLDHDAWKKLTNSDQDLLDDVSNGNLVDDADERQHILDL